MILLDFFLELKFIGMFIRIYLFDIIDLVENNLRLWLLESNRDDVWCCYRECLSNHCSYLLGILCILSQVILMSFERK